MSTLALVAASLNRNTSPAKTAKKLRTRNSFVDPMICSLPAQDFASSPCLLSEGIDRRRRGGRPRLDQSWAINGRYSQHGQSPCGLDVEVEVAVGVSVFIRVDDGVGVRVSVRVGVAVRVAVEVALGVRVGPPGVGVVALKDRMGQ